MTSNVVTVVEECPCWRETYRLGHPGHCCFLVDDRPAEGIVGDTEWRPEPCHVPVYVYQRDRSWWKSRPSGGHAPRWHRESPVNRSMAACSPRIMLTVEIPGRADLMPGDLLCRRCFP